jgi:hypothetical protein
MQYTGVGVTGVLARRPSFAPTMPPHLANCTRELIVHWRYDLDVPAHTKQHAGRWRRRESVDWHGRAASRPRGRLRRRTLQYWSSSMSSRIDPHPACHQDVARVPTKKKTLARRFDDVMQHTVLAQPDHQRWSCLTTFRCLRYHTNSTRHYRVRTPAIQQLVLSSASSGVRASRRPPTTPIFWTPLRKRLIARSRTSHHTRTAPGTRLCHACPRGLGYSHNCSHQQALESVMITVCSMHLLYILPVVRGTRRRLER